MAKQPKLTKLLAPTVPLTLSVDDGAHKLELNLAWTMRGVILLESKLRNLGVDLNVLQNPSEFWSTLDCTKLALGVWCMSQQDHPEYADEEGFEIITSFLVVDNYGDAATALKSAFLESLSKSRREEIKKAEEAAAKNGEAAKENPTPAPVQ